MTLTLGQRLKKIREDHGMTAQQLAKELNLLKTVVWGFEMDKREPTVSNLLKYADYFGVSVDHLLGRNERPVFNEEQYVQDLERPIGEFLEKYFIVIEGHQASEEEISDAVAFIKAKRMMKEVM
ncbi:helix-turn-helix domain-containing protein [Camelliibacillus cellulosilyticus]|uniref:Helix-turn-helix domain-containing protein n=1 Tax=Camelliibacillus cellulosilyticus TaxID=2174486 RepID=A0ABV9GR24_9BACL